MLPKPKKGDVLTAKTLSEIIDRTSITNTGADVSNDTTGMRIVHRPCRCRTTFIRIINPCAGRGVYWAREVNLISMISNPAEDIELDNNIRVRYKNYVLAINLCELNKNLPSGTHILLPESGSYIPPKDELFMGWKTDYVIMYGGGNLPHRIVIIDAVRVLWHPIT